MKDIEELKKELTIVIPTLNEEEAIGKVLDELLELGYNKTITHIHQIGEKYIIKNRFNINGEFKLER